MQITPEPCFSPHISLSCCMGIRPRNVTWLPIADESNRCTFWTSCKGLSWKRPFFWILRNFSYIWLSELRIFAGRFLHRGTDIRLRMWYFGCFKFSFYQIYMVKKGRHNSAGGTALHMVHGTRDWAEHILDKSSFCIKKTLLPVHNAWIWAQFDHSSLSWWQVQCTQSFK